MPPKAINAGPLAKPVRTSLRRQVFDLIAGEDLTFREPADAEPYENYSDAATRVGRKLREKYSRYVTDARQKTGKTYECNTSREWEEGRYVVTYQIICRG